MPTALETQGDFSKSLNIDGGVRTIFDPWTSLLNQDGSVSVTPFPGNVVPQSRFDPLAATLIKEFWAPNNPGANITGVNNYKKGFIEKYDYYNFSERADYNINDKWRVFGRLARYNTTDIAGQPDAQQLRAVRAHRHRAGRLERGRRCHLDRQPANSGGISRRLARPDRRLRLRSPRLDGWGSIWPNNAWYEPYHTASVGAPVYFPNLNIGGSAFGGGGFYWNQAPKGEAASASRSRSSAARTI